MRAKQCNGSVLTDIPVAKASRNETCEYSIAGRNIDSLGVNNPTTKSEVVCDILRAYHHDYEAEGDSISKRRLWYILKPTFDKADLSGIINKKTGKNVIPITNADYNKQFNILAKSSEIDDTYISDNSRTVKVGRLLPMIVLAVEKSTVDTAVLKLADDLGISCYIAKGFSSIYAAKKLKAQMDAALDFEPYELTSQIFTNPEWYNRYYSEPEETDLMVLNMTDYDKSGMEISDTIDNHFNADEAYRVLLNLSQVPADKIGEYFDINADGTRAYELDILNIHQLRDIFLESIPAHVADIIISKRQNDVNLQRRDDLVPDAIDDDDAVVGVQTDIDDLETEKRETEERYKKAIAKIEKLMENATKNVDSSIEDEEKKLLNLKVKLFPEYLETSIPAKLYL